MNGASVMLDYRGDVDDIAEVGRQVAVLLDDRATDLGGQRPRVGQRPGDDRAQRPTDRQPAGGDGGDQRARHLCGDRLHPVPVHLSSHRLHRAGSRCWCVPRWPPGSVASRRHATPRRPRLRLVLRRPLAQPTPVRPQPPRRPTRTRPIRRARPSPRRAQAPAPSCASAPAGLRPGPWATGRSVWSVSRRRAGRPRTRRATRTPCGGPRRPPVVPRRPTGPSPPPYRRPLPRESRGSDAGVAKGLHRLEIVDRDECALEERVGEDLPPR